ncbi:MAG TPA: LLM class flavin-dependent oxidoreductase [Anaerolineales bacterium]|nr:LLM class flavin-dependent oxidoreductase [Anaerolineales bacterium]
MKFGFVLPFGDARIAADFAALAEQAGWDGFFVWEPVWGIDAWVSLTAAAMCTEHIRLGTMVTPLSRMRPWKLASEAATLDNLSNGRVIISVGLGALDTGFEAFGEVTERRKRAELLDEGLDILTGLWRGQPFSYQGKHYTIKETDFYPPPPPVQRPHIPIWVVGLWGSKKSMGRALRYDGLLPAFKDERSQWRQSTPEDIHQVKAFIGARLAEEASFDIVVEGETPGDEPRSAAEKVLPWFQAGATWWIEALWEIPRDESGLDQLRKRISQGPPPT